MSRVLLRTTLGPRKRNLKTAVVLRIAWCRGLWWLLPDPTTVEHSFKNCRRYGNRIMKTCNDGLATRTCSLAKSKCQDTARSARNALCRPPRKRLLRPILSQKRWFLSCFREWSGKTPRETQKERNGGGKGKKKSEILGGPAEGGPMEGGGPAEGGPGKSKPATTTTTKNNNAKPRTTRAPKGRPALPSKV